MLHGHVDHNFDGTVGVVVEQSTAALRVAGSIPARNKHLYALQIVVPGLAVCVRVCVGIYVNAPTILELHQVLSDVKKKLCLNSWIVRSHFYMPF